ncbi:aldehyde dehydrogenase family protein [Spirochaeta africana]|uniref:NAD-dependent aldehyde dehydrogenase n=1 Tax=Spirochaeta africana (strain ATCC 700263 / DSM 8902 / Z-7692) TaxID=889378 RepID=H9UFE5_SPIAZ|nr:aldehyde dehydrogenase family protein [Spirochaeta africana]AFG36238.1 NAD-dependent aldehyde dehydrogenase [Spirochaeta africana DSM 8902]
MSDDAGYIAELVTRARRAQEQIADYTQQQIDDVCLSVGWEVYEDRNIADLARVAVESSGMGNVPDKITKHKVKVLGVLKDLKGAISVGEIFRDPGRGITKYAKPVGVVGALLPVTNPTATPASNGLSILKGRNAVIFAPHPRAAAASKLAVEYMRQGLKRVGAPEDLVQITEEPSIGRTGELMKQVDLVVATGGGAMVKAAYSSGTPAYGVGPGNSVQIIAEDADLPDAVAKIALSKVFDYATSCSSENSVIIHQDLYEQAVARFVEHEHSYLIQGEEREQLERWMWRPNKHGVPGLNPAIIAQSAVRIAADAGIQVPEETRILLVEGRDPLEQDHFAEEKLCPVLTLYRARDFAEAVDLLTRLTDNAGTGHSCGIHTFRSEYVHELGMRMRTSRIMVRQAQAPANGGNFFNGMPSTVTLGCGTWGGNSTTENINYRHFLNVTWVSEPIPVEKPSDEEMWGDFHSRYPG